MPGPKNTHFSPTRRNVLQALANATEPLNRRQLAALTGATPTGVRDSLIRPRRAGWVSAELVVEDPFARRLYYTITDDGREALADHLKETTP